MQLLAYNEIPANLSQWLLDSLAHEAYLKRQLGPILPFAFSFQEEGKLIGAIQGASFYGGLQIDSLFIEKAYRGKGPWPASGRGSYRARSSARLPYHYCLYHGF